MEWVETEELGFESSSCITQCPRSQSLETKLETQTIHGQHTRIRVVIGGYVVKEKDNLSPLLTHVHIESVNPLRISN